jgi:serine/threonine-protein kinase
VAEQIDVLREGLAGQYEVDRAVGQGGMATVYLARDLRHERKVAIKVLKPELAASIGHERFLREIKLASQLQHPNILGFYESGEANGLVYYSMPFIEGESLRDRIDKEKQLGVEEAVRIVREAGEALGYAHSHGIVHRDIKPENILLLDGHALVADFGIAKAVEAAGGEKLTETGMAVGTPHYMSPEQALGGSVDGRSDQYSLACVLYECLIGQTPFDGPSPMAVLARHAMEQVPSLQLVRNTIPDSVEDVVFRAMEKTPADRYPSMKEFAEALEDAEADVHVQRTAARRAQNQPRTAQHRMPTGATRRATTPIQIESTAPKKKWPVYAGGAVAVLAALGGGFFFLKGGSAKPAAAVDASADARRVAVLYFEDQSPNKALGYLTDGLTEDLIKEIATVPTLQVVSRGGVVPYRTGEVPRDSIARALKVGTLVVGSVETAGADKVRVTARLVDASGTEFSRSSFEAPAGDPLAMRDLLAGRVAASLRERLGEEVRVLEQKASTKSPEAWSLLQRAEQALKGANEAAAQGDSSAATRGFETADSLARLAGEKDGSWNDPTVFRGRLNYRRSRLAVSNPAQAKTFIEQGMGFAETALGRDNTDADALELRGTLQYWRFLMRLDQDEATANRLLEAARKDLEESTRLRPTQAGAWGSLSHLYARDEKSTLTDVVLAARRAYEADAYLENAPKVLQRLFGGYYDLDQAVDAAHWCEEGHRRFPQDQAFTMCQILLMTMRGQNPDPAKAWQLADGEALAKDPTGGNPEFRKRMAQQAVAAVLARAGLKDSAKSVARSAVAGSDVDPQKELYREQAFALLLADDKAGAVTALKTFLAANPDYISGFATDASWRFRDLESDPAFRKLVGKP